MQILRSSREIAMMRKAGLMVWHAHQLAQSMLEPGVTTGEIDAAIEALFAKHGAEPLFKGVPGKVPFPAVTCMSVNEEVVHGMPSPRRHLAEGDIVGLDFGVVRGGYYGDSAITLGVGKTSEKADDLIRITREALDKGIEQMHVGNRIRDISEAIQNHAEASGYGVVRDFVGHGIGQRLHEEPQVPNYVGRGQNPRLKEGMVLAVEPMVCEGTYEVEVLDDGWTAVTRDRKLAAHFEHSIAITEDGPEVLTRV